MTNEEKKEYILGLKGKLSDKEIRKSIGEIFGVGKSRRNKIFRKIFNIVKAKEVMTMKPAHFKESGDNAVAECRNEDVKTLDELLAACDVDLNEWRVEKYIVNKWATARSNKQANITFVDGVMTGSTQDKGGMTVQPLYQVKAWLIRRKEVKDKTWVLEEFRKAVLAQPAKNFPISPVRTGMLYEISMPDIHFGKLAWAKETGGTDYDSTIATDIVKKALGHLVSYISSASIEKFLLPIGNDFFNSDNSETTTTAGTPQDDDSRWQKTFTRGFQLMIDVVEYLCEFAPVDVVIVSGNHDNERSFYLGECLASYFRNNKGVKVDNTPTQRKYYRWNNVLLGLTHGNEEKHAELPLIMATERPKDWAECDTKIFQLGHYHREKLEDFKGVKVHTLPSLCAADSWHAKKGYIGSKRSAEGLLFDKSQGLVANFYYHTTE